MHSLELNAIIMSGNIKVRVETIQLLHLFLTCAGHYDLKCFKFCCHHCVSTDCYVPNSGVKHTVIYHKMFASHISE